MWLNVSAGDHIFLGKNELNLIKELIKIWFLGMYWPARPIFLPWIPLWYINVMLTPSAKSDLIHLLRFQVKRKNFGNVLVVCHIGIAAS